MNWTRQNVEKMDLGIPENFKLINIANIKKDTYYISEYGEIFSVHINKKIKPKKDKDGYYQVVLSTGEPKKRKFWKVHQLVARTYIGEPPQYIKDPTVDHIDSNRDNNFYKNLRWMERAVNSSIRKNKGVGEANHEAVLNEQQVIEICELLVQNKKTLQEIADLFHVEKTTISNIKRKKAWKHLTKSYKFEIKKQKNKEDSIKQKEEIFELLKIGILPKDIVKMGYSKTVVYRYSTLFNITSNKVA